MKRKLLSMLLSAFMVFGVVPQMIPALQAGAAGLYSADSYSQLVSALANAHSGDTIDICADIVVTDQVSVDKSVIINGNGHTLSVPEPGLSDAGLLNDSPSLFRVFAISSVAGTVTINDAIIKGGASISAGSGIFNAANLRLNRVRISNSGGLYSPGGGLANSAMGTIYLNGCNISRNGAEYGGGFYNQGTMYIENSTFSENRSLNTGGGGGAGENRRYLYVNNSTFSNNESTELGGAINNYGGSQYVLNSTFTGNISTTNFFDSYGGSTGGAIRTGSQDHFVNCLFAYNYSASQDGLSYALNDFDVATVDMNYCLYQGNASATFTGVGNNRYLAAADGSDNTVFAGGATARVINAYGSEIGSVTVFQPFLARISNMAAPTALRVEGTALVPNPVVDAGTKTGFASVSGTPVAGYYNRSSHAWVSLVGAHPENAVVTTDQNGVTRAEIPVIGAVETAASNLCMLKVNAAANGTVEGGNVYGDVYASGAEVTLTAIPSQGYRFAGWNYLLGGSGTPTDNPYRISVTQDTTLVPVFSMFDGYTVDYVGNGNTGGTVPDAATFSSGEETVISGNIGNLVREGYTFHGWNTRSNGSGIDYPSDFSYSLGLNLVLYAQWSGINAATPHFTANLSGEATYRKDTAASSLSVGATAADSGSVTYQWYKSSSATDNGAAIAGATGTCYTPQTEQTGVAYYYAVATNTNPSVTGFKTARATSDFYKVTVNRLEVLAPVIPGGAPTTDVQSGSEEVKQAVLTDADRESLDTGSDISIYLKVEAIDASQDVQSLVSASLDGKSLGQYLDISLIKNIDGSETQVTQTNSLIRVVITVPESLRASGRTFSVIRIHDGVATTLEDLDSDPNTITVETDRFSSYTIAYADPAGNPGTGDQGPAFPLALFGLISAAAVFPARKKHIFRRKTK